MFRITPGRAAVLLIVALGTSLAAFNVWYRYTTTHRIHQRWGTEAMQRVAEAPQAEWWELAAASDHPPKAAEGSGEIEVDGRKYATRRRGDLIAARGFMHLRNSLGQDASYGWAEDQRPPNAWRWAIVFVEGDQRTVLLVDEANCWMRTLEASEAVELTEKMSAGFKTFFAEQVHAK